MRMIKETLIIRQNSTQNTVPAEMTNLDTEAKHRDDDAESGGAHTNIADLYGKTIQFHLKDRLLQAEMRKGVKH